MNVVRRILAGLTASGVLMASMPVHAGVIVHGTRQIFPGDQREITVHVENVGNTSSLVQAWTDAGDKYAAPEASITPFVLRPPVFRLDGGKSQSLRILRTTESLPQDRESIYWLNVMDIPPVPSAEEVPTGNYVQFSLRTRIKLIYRPKGLDAAAGAAQKLQWTLVADGQGWAVQAVNPTPYYVHFTKVSLRAHGNSHASTEPAMLAPMSSARYPLAGLVSRPVGGNVQFQYINDFGATEAQSVALAGP